MCWRGGGGSWRHYIRYIQDVPLPLYTQLKPLTLNLRIIIINPSCFINLVGYTTAVKNFIIEFSLSPSYFKSDLKIYLEKQGNWQFLDACYPKVTSLKKYF